ncbi:4-hydroxythreonine-4-phosphate dehydrogenase PdxA [Devosia geojensis]|nr:4-hydroxythreonine-4-phosphate dehydrogenase PdxA [Devosia geojensis]
MGKPLAISMGEPAGIGPDLILAAYAARAELALPPFCVFGNTEFLAQRARRLGIDIPLASVSPDEASSRFDTTLPVVEVGGPVPDTPGEIDPLAGRTVIAAIERAVAAVRTGSCRGLVTAPIHKAALYHAGFTHPGHTEFLAALCADGGAPRRPVMMLAHEGLRAVPLTIHVPLLEVPRLVTGQAVIETVRIVHHDLKHRFGIAAPRIALAGLNPHAGESGSIGREEIDIIAPAVAQLAAEGIDVVGPLPGDTLFYPPHWRTYDAVIAMYHDQALIPIKTVAFDEAVNVTLGLPIVRTSPDHGTAFDLAGTGRASPKSFLAAIRMADAMTRERDA